MMNETTSTSFTLTGLSPGVLYTIRLVAVSHQPDETVCAEASGGPLTVRTMPNAPQNFSGETQGTTTIGLSWMAPDSTNGATFDKYEITYTPFGGARQTVEVDDPSDTSTSLTGLSPGVQYSISLVTVSADPNPTESVEASGGPLTVRTMPNAPQRFSGETQGTTTIALTWMAPDSTNNATFDKYRITYTPSGGNDETKEVTANTTTLTGLSPGVLYTIRLVAVSHQPDETVSAEASGGPLTVRTKPNAPRDFTRTAVSTTTIGLSWNAPDSTNGAAFAKYRITYTPSGGTEQPKEVTTTSTTLTGLSPGVLYTVSLVAVSADDNIISAEASGGPLTVRTKPNAPQEFAETSTTTDSVSLNWTTPDSANNAAFAKYRITYSSDGGSQIKELNDTGTTSTTLTGLSPGVQYTISLVTVSDEPYVTVSAEATGGPLTVRTKPNAPSGFTETTVNTTAISLSWTAPGSANSATFAKYRITYSANGNSQVKEITDTAATSTTLTGLSPGVLYTISLVAVSADPTVTVSQEAGGGPISVRTKADKPTDLEATSVNTTAIALNWMQPDSGTFHGYELSYTSADSGVTNNRTIDNETVTETTLTGLKPGDLYDISVLAFSGSGNAIVRSETDNLQVRTFPEKPVGLTCTKIERQLQINLDWNKPAASIVDRYEVLVTEDGDGNRTIPREETTAEVDNLKADTEYTFYVVTITGTRRSANSSATCKTDLAPPPDVTKPNVTGPPTEPPKTSSFVVNLDTSAFDESNGDIQVYNVLVQEYDEDESSKFAFVATIFS
ncbi:fibronectin-like [Branchiostoma floridae]|uniref:Fibronectin-like n=1 Tax=Branchiostoma floridae TaxID=7739 RepID=A0A9J7HQ33_BRAFL|nr:fibronectin-like [Branchiostoma floridae]